MLVVAVEERDALNVFQIVNQAGVNLVNLAFLLFLGEAVEDVDGEELNEQVAEGELHQTEVIAFHPILILDLDFFHMSNKVDWIDVFPPVIKHTCRLVVPVRPVKGRSHIDDEERPVNQERSLVYHVVVHSNFPDDATNLHNRN